MKIQRFNEIQKEFDFYPESNFNLFKARFYESDLGKLYLAIPWDDLIQDFELKEKRDGRPLIFPPQGRIALMFLKNYSGLSDYMLTEQLNGNMEWQFFCGIYLGQTRLSNYKIISQIRSELSAKLDIRKLQETLYDYWAPYLQEVEKITIDATCYESEVRYPTDVKLLWECVEWCNRIMIVVSKLLGQPHLRTKYIKRKKRSVSYSKMRRKTKKKRTGLTRSSLLLIKKLTNFLEPYQELLSERERAKLRTIKKVYTQQYALFHKGIKPKKRIISLQKDYLRPIVRGKEIKKVVPIDTMIKT